MKDNKEASHDGKRFSDYVKGAEQAAADAVGSTKKFVSDTTNFAQKSVLNAVDENGNGQIDIEDIIIKGLKTPGIKINRESFLKTELFKRYPKKIIDDAVAYNPLHANISTKEIDAIADEVIAHERYFVSGISAALGVPGGAAMAATVPTDIIQYYAYMLRTVQELMYLYGWPKINTEDKDGTFDAETMNTLILCLGCMYGVAGANRVINVMAAALGEGVEKKLMDMALTKTLVFSVVKDTSKWFGLNLTKSVFAGFFKEAIPLVGGVVSGSITYLSFAPCCEKLKKSLQHTMLCDPNYTIAMEDQKLITGLTYE